MPGATVFINGRSLVHKGDGQTQVSPTPDVCLTPSPGGPPVPVPYVNSAQDAQLQGGTTSVIAEGNPVALEDASLATSTGDEAGSGGGVISGKIKGKLTWASASIDVKFEGKGVVRFLDVCLHNGNVSNAGGQPQLGLLAAPTPIAPPESQTRAEADEAHDDEYDTYALRLRLTHALRLKGAAENDTGASDADEDGDDSKDGQGALWAPTVRCVLVGRKCPDDAPILERLGLLTARTETKEQSQTSDNASTEEADEAVYTLFTHLDPTLVYSLELHDLDSALTEAPDIVFENLDWDTLQETYEV